MAKTESSVSYSCYFAVTPCLITCLCVADLHSCVFMYYLKKDGKNLVSGQFVKRFFPPRIFLLVPKSKPALLIFCIKRCESSSSRDCSQHKHASSVYNALIQPQPSNPAVTHALKTISVFHSSCFTLSFFHGCF